MNEQREIIYGERRRVLDGESMRDTVYNMITEYVENITDRFASPEAAAEDWDVKGLELNLHKIIPMMELPSEKECIDMRQKELKHLLKERAVKAYEVKEAEFPEAEQIRRVRACRTSKSNRCKMDGSYRRYGSASSGNRSSGIRTERSAC